MGGEGGLKLRSTVPGGGLPTRHGFERGSFVPFARLIRLTKSQLSR